MQRVVIEEILRDAESVENRENEWVVSAGGKLDLLGSAGTDVMTVQDVCSIRLEESFLALTNDKNDIFYLEYDRVIGVRLRGGAGRQRASRAGFAAD